MRKLILLILACEAFAAFIAEHGIGKFYIAGADATACVKSTCFNMAKAGYIVHVISDCVTSYDLKKVERCWIIMKRRAARSNLC